MWAAPVGQNAVGVPCLLPRGPNKQDGVAFLKDPRPKKYSRGRMDRSGTVQSGTGRTGPDRSGPDRSGLVWTGSDRPGTVRTLPDRSGAMLLGAGRGPGSPEARDRGSGHGPWGAGLGPLWTGYLGRIVGKLAFWSRLETHERTTHLFLLSIWGAAPESHLLEWPSTF